MKRKALIEKTNLYADSIFDKILKECDCGSSDKKIILDDEIEESKCNECGVGGFESLDEELEDLDEQAWRAGVKVAQNAAKERQLAMRAANMAKARGIEPEKAKQIIKRSSSGAMI